MELEILATFLAYFEKKMVYKHFSVGVCKLPSMTLKKIKAVLI